MKREILFFLSCLGWALMIFILFTHGQSIAGSAAGAPAENLSSDTRLRLLSMPIAIAAMPMNISFHGKSGSISDAGDWAVNRRIAMGLEANGTGLGPLPGFNDHLARIQSFLLKYVTIGTHSADTPLPALSMEGDTNKKISLEFQAGLTDLSGAVFIVMQI